MKLNEYQDFVKSKLSPQAVETKEAQVTNSLLGLCGEVGELADLYKKYKFHGHELDLGKVEKELGDIAFYLMEAIDGFGLLAEDVLATNVIKLNTRYPSGFSVEDSIIKRDQNENN